MSDLSDSLLSYRPRPRADQAPVVSRRTGRTPGDVLIVGADSMLGTAIAELYREQGRTVFETTRRADTVSEKRPFLDLHDVAAFSPPLGVTTAIVCAAVTSFDKCDNDPDAFEVNVRAPVQLAAALNAAGIFVVFLSTNAVFGGDRAFCGEDDPLLPSAAYAWQKAQAERALSQMLRDDPDAGCIVRLTKVLTANTRPLPDWLRALTAGHPIHPFSDLIFAPISLQFAARALARIADAQLPGPFHLSGKENLSYADFAMHTVAALGLPTELVQPMTAAQAGVKLAFQPRYSAMGMARTQAQFDIAPQPAHSIIADLLA
jgi:dTDP-4-dehydrorhamnose reductase